MKLSKDELLYRQSLPLEIKVSMTARRIIDFTDYYGNDGVYVSFSGGKDSRVLLDIARKSCRNILAVYLDTWLEYPQIREYVNQFDNVKIIKPEKSMKQIIADDGWCFPSKDVAEAIDAYRKGRKWAINKLNGLDKDGKPSKFREQYKKWLPLVDCPIKISHKCCIDMKEKPVQKFERETGRKPILALMAEESARRKEAYLRTGCNSFGTNRPISKPMGFWTEQDVLKYTVKNKIELALPYGNIVESGQINGQMSLDCLNCKYKTTGEKRTGCMFCPVSGHLDNFGKLTRLRKYNSDLYDYCMEELGEKELVEWVRKKYLKGVD